MHAKKQASSKPDLVFRRPGPTATSWILALLVVADPLVPAVITVEGGCSLVEATHSANSDTAVGGCPAGSGADTIVLTADVSLSAIEVVDEGNNGLPTVVSEITIQGGHHVIQRSSGAPSEFRIQKVGPTGSLTLDRVTVLGGQEVIGGALLNDGVLVLQSTTVSDSRALLFGGAILSTGALSVRDSRISSNQVFGVGGDFAFGGAIVSYGALTIEGSTFESNRAGSLFTPYGVGGAVYHQSGYNLIISDSTFSANIAEGTSIGIGGAIYSVSGLTMTNSTISGNTSSSVGSGALQGEFTLNQVTLSGNSPHALVSSFGNPSAKATIIANTIGGSNCFGAIGDDLNNLADDTSCGTIPSSLFGLDPNLTDNGGPTRTHALLEGSNAIEAAGFCSSPADQRGAPRIDACDIGAYEYLGCPVLELTDSVIASAETYEECAISVGPDLHVVGPGGDLILRVGATASFTDGFSIGADARLTVERDPPLALLIPELVEADRARRAEREP